ncbi:MAG: hypothetical protein EOM12_16525 [Verrucomicrobiae bacterium]|nr:hypothetical protein [Verrucomicrobiae bacterium]
MDGMKKPGTIKDFLNTGGSNQVEKDYDWYMKNDAAGLIKMQKEQPEQYEMLIEKKRKKRGE